MTSFQWSSTFETNLAQVDEQHRHLVEIINTFGDRLASGSVDPEMIESVFAQLADYATYHFQEEEKLMALRGVDLRHRESHAEDHRNFLSDVTSLHAAADSGGPGELKNLLDFLVNWLAFHMLGSDQNMARQIRSIESGDSAEDAYATQELEASRATEPLVLALTSLFEVIATRNRQLMQLNESLEEKVEDRTRELSDANRRLEELSLTDALTGLYNRRYALRALETLWSEAESKDHPLCCVMIDADYFKAVNDTHGHDAGDRVLIELTRTLGYTLRTDDVLCRLGGDEFLVICPNTDLNGGMFVGRQLHQAVQELAVPVGDGVWNGSISVGVAAKTKEMTEHEQLIKAADLGVYSAKQAGKGCVRAASDSSDASPTD